MRVNKTDNLAATLPLLNVGDIINGGGISWSIQAVTDSGTYWSFVVAPASTGAAGTQDFDFETVTPTPISVGYEVDYWLTNPPPQGTVQGLYVADGGHGDLVASDNAYGVDGLFQNAYIPTEWAVKISSAGANGGGLNAAGGPSSPRPTVYKDMLSAVGSARVPPSNAPRSEDFGPAGVLQRQEFAFDVGDYVFIQPFHTNHDIMPEGKAFIHVHWSTDGVSTGNVKWEFLIQRAIGHNQASFFNETTRTIEQAGSGTAWQHMISEVIEGEELIMVEPDELILITLRRVAASSNENTDSVFGMEIDLHYESNYIGTPLRAPPFYM
jgi:hypothetical protein